MRRRKRKSHSLPVMIGTGLAFGVALLVFFVGRKTIRIPELLPTQINWAGNP